MLINEFGLTKYKHFFFTSLSGEWVSLFKNTGDFVIRALCTNHVIGKFRCKQNEYKSISKHIYYWPTLCSKTIHQKAFHSRISGTLFSIVILLRAIMEPEYKPISVVRNGHAGCNVMTPQCHVMIPLKINMIFLDLCNISVVKFQCHTYTFCSDFLFFTSVGHL